MSLSTRWHEPSCKTPQVVVDGNVPECRSCGSSAEALLQRAADEPAPSFSGISLPPEAPIGQMDLWWPPCVPYTLNGVRKPRPEVSSGDAACLMPQGSALESSLSEIYTSILEKDRFRLLYLSGSRLIDGPIHGDLVEYPRDNCPEYETTSYTWGGEDVDATPCKPAYFGEFWDVMFVTRNCWSLLQYLRPPMGTRVVWVDAICINQNSLPERGAQVSSMPQIYRNCMRVVIYPGDHLVRKEQGRFRQQIRHDDLVEHDTNAVNDDDPDVWGSVLQNRYMRRVWIIQELILAPSAVLALKDHDLYLSNNFLHLVSQKDDKRKWLEYMGQDYKLRKTTLLEGLQKTLESQATDPRDRIFGILGILWGNATYSKIVPDYSISMRDCVVGTMGLTLLVSKEIWPLLYVSTSHSTSGYPAWVPNLDEQAGWTDKTTKDWSRRGWVLKVPSKWTTISLSAHDYYTLGRLQTVEFHTTWWQDGSIDSGSGALTLNLVRIFDKPHRVVTVDGQNGGFYQYGMFFDEGPHFAVETPYAGAWFQLPTEETPQTPEQPCYIFLAFPDTYIIFATEADAFGAFTIVQSFPITDMVCTSAIPAPQPSTIFSTLDLDYERHVKSLFGILCLTTNYNTRNERCPARIFYFDHPDRPYTSHPWDNTCGTVSEAMLFDMIVPGGGDASDGFLQLSLSAGRAGNPITVTEEFRRAYANCLQTAPADFKPVLDDEYVWFTLDDDDALSHYWSSMIKHLSDIDTFKRDAGSELWPLIITDLWVPWDILFPTWFDLQIPGIGNTLFNEQNCKLRKWREYAMGEPPCFDRCALHEDYKSHGNLSLKYWLPCTTEVRELQMPVRARMPLIKVVEAIRSTELNRLHRRLLAFSELVSEDVESLLKRGPQPKDLNVYLQLDEWPKSLVDELGFVWRHELVTFV